MRRACVKAASRNGGVELDEVGGSRMAVRERRRRTVVVWRLIFGFALEGEGEEGSGRCSDLEFSSMSGFRESGYRVR